MDLTSARPLFGISVAAELTGVDPQMLRTYEARGLLEPHRTDGGTRRYSQDDLQIVQRITDLLGGGLNLAGVAQVLLLEAENHRLRREIAALHEQLAAPASGRATPTRPKRPRRADADGPR